MKTTLAVMALIFSAALAQAALVMELDFAPIKIKTVIKIKGDKLRSDSGGISRIADFETGENFILDHGLKQVKKLPALFDDTDAKAKWPKFQDTGKSEMLNGYEAEIYKWTSFDGRAEILWIAKNYPNFDQIKNDISKLDRFNNTKWIPELNSISGMPLKLVIAHGNSVTNGIDMSITLLSAKEEPIDGTNFDLPKDYHFYSTNAPVANTNEVISTTNESAIK